MRTLCSGDAALITELIESYEKGSEALLTQIIDICYYMKGGITYDDAWAVSFHHREMIVQSLNKHIREENGGQEYL
jgi:uncharacterized protein YbgA (DUF1722 family)